MQKLYQIANITLGWNWISYLGRSRYQNNSADPIRPLWWTGGVEQEKRTLLISQFHSSEEVIAPLYTPPPPRQWRRRHKWGNSLMALNRWWRSRFVPLHVFLQPNPIWREMRYSYLHHDIGEGWSLDIFLHPSWGSDALWVGQFFDGIQSIVTF